jgi:hypothetical protein
MKNKQTQHSPQLLTFCLASLKCRCGRCPGLVRNPPIAGTKTGTFPLGPQTAFCGRAGRAGGGRMRPGISLSSGAWLLKLTAVAGSRVRGVPRQPPCWQVRSRWRLAGAADPLPPEGTCCASGQTCVRLAASDAAGPLLRRPGRCANWRVRERKACRARGDPRTRPRFGWRGVMIDESRHFSRQADGAEDSGRTLATSAQAQPVSTGT